mgnify:CR=1 FL=1
MRIYISPQKYKVESFLWKYKLNFQGVVEVEHYNHYYIELTNELYGIVNNISWIDSFALRNSLSSSAEFSAVSNTNKNTGGAHGKLCNTYSMVVTIFSAGRFVSDILS